MDGSVELEIPARPEYIALARLVVASFAASAGLHPDERIDDLRVAVSEACTNAIEAHGVAASEDRIVIRCAALDGGVEVVVEDRGGGFDPTVLPERLGPGGVGSPAGERGLGIPIIRSLADHVEFRSSPAGTSVRILLRSEET